LLRVSILLLAQVVFGPSQWGSVPGGVPRAGVRTGLDEGSHRLQGARTDGVVERGAVRVQVRTRSVDVRTRLEHPLHRLRLPVQCGEDERELLLRLARRR